MSQQSLELAKAHILEPSELSTHDITQALSGAMKHYVDYGDIFLQYQESESWILEQGIVKEGQYSIDSGFGFRLTSGEATGFAYSDELSLASLTTAQEAVGMMLRQGQDRSVMACHDVLAPTRYAAINPLNTMPDHDKVDLLKQLESKVRAQSSLITQANLSLSASYNVVLMVNNEGQWFSDVRPLMTLWLSVIAERDGRRERGASVMGGRFALTYLNEHLDQEQFVDKAVRQALTNLESVSAPMGEMPVVLGPGWPGVLLHEAVGHGLEGDFNRKKTSAFADRVGEQVATSACTVVDDATINDRRGSLSVDDEGVVGQKTLLIDQGILTGYMQDRHNAHLMGVSSTGNGRRESYAHRPLPRMTNTYMLPGEHTPEEVIASVDRGIYAVDFSGGQVDITSGNFVFSMSEAYLIEQGKITVPLKGATLIGDGPTVMQRISMVANDLALDGGIGTCGKDGQSVPVGVGQPTLKIDKVVVGGHSS